jgi:hypothetical protein
MNKFLACFVSAIIVVGVAFLLAFMLLPKVNNFGGGFNAKGGVVITDQYNYSTITVNQYASTSYSLASRNTDLVYRSFCNVGNGLAYLYATSASAYVVAGEGIALTASTTAPYKNCQVWKEGDELYLGQVMAVVVATTTFAITER